MKPRYCFWSVCDGPYGAMMEHCVRTARQAGVFKEFHVLADRPLEGCESYDAYQIDKAHGLFKLHYLKVGMSRSQSVRMRSGSSPTLRHQSR